MKKGKDSPDERDKGFDKESLRVLEELKRENKSLKDKLQATKLAREV